MSNPWKASTWKSNPITRVKGWMDLMRALKHVKEPSTTPQANTQSSYTAYEGRPYSFRSLEGTNNGDKDVPIESTAIKHVRFDEDTNTTYITFVGGDTEYAYNTTPDDMQEFLHAPSKGRLVSTTWNHNPRFRK